MYRIVILTGQESQKSFFTERILNAAEHLRALCPTCKIIWCSDLDFSLHAFRLRIDYFLLEPVTEENFCQGLCAWFKRKIPVTRSSDCNEHNKEDHS